MKLTWDDLLIEDIGAEDFACWMESWRGFISGGVAPVFLNKFGCWFLRRPEGPVDMLDVFTGEVERIAETYEAFTADVNDPAWQEVYLLSGLVYDLHQSGIVPGPGECYALAPHPALGGPNPFLGEAVDPRFVMTMDIAAWQSICSQASTGT
jgi:hypothetical protein